jgi:pyridoxal phosphate enzyme (YggS family)
MGIGDNLIAFRTRIPDNVKVVAVSKTKPNEDILEAYQAGQRIFGENKVQDLVAKQPQLPDDIQWHYIGHLQTNKVKFLAPFVNLIHAVDSLKLLKEMNKQGLKNNRIIDCLLQFHIAKEETKFGLSIAEAEEILGSEVFQSLTNVRVTGVMGMATYTTNENQVRSEFRQLLKYFEELKSTYFGNSDYFREISMGMSGDFTIAIEEGSTMIRVGTLIFGERNK